MDSHQRLGIITKPTTMNTEYDKRTIIEIKVTTISQAFSILFVTCISVIDFFQSVGEDWHLRMYCYLKSLFLHTVLSTLAFQPSL